MIQEFLQDGLSGLGERLDRRRALASLKPLARTGRQGSSLFIDCGGYDGCSAVKFVLANPDCDSITFEPNPEMWPYYENVPTTLVKAGVAAEEGDYDFFIDHVDGDGSTILKEKVVIFGGGPENEKVKAQPIHCHDLVDVVTRMSARYDNLILKLDVEGAEYDILEKLVDTGAIRHVEAIHCEFHWKKCGIPKSRHDRLVSALRGFCPVLEWDALNFAVHGRGDDRRAWRNGIVAERLGDIGRYGSVAL